MHYGRAAYCAVCFSRLDQWPIKIKCRRLIESEIKSKFLITFLFLIIFFNGFQFLKGEIQIFLKLKKKIFFFQIIFRLEVPISRDLRLVGLGSAPTLVNMLKSASGKLKKKYIGPWKFANFYSFMISNLLSNNLRRNLIFTRCLSWVVNRFWSTEGVRWSTPLSAIKASTGLRRPPWHFC